MTDQQRTQPILAYMLLVLFVGLKLTHYIDWSWWWVLSPVWIPWAIALLYWSVRFLIGFCVGFTITWRRGQRARTPARSQSPED